MATTFQLSVLTPERTVFEGPVEYVQVPGTEGYLGVLANHAALVTGLAKGTLTLRHPGGREAQMGVEGGFFEVSHNRATVLADAGRRGRGHALVEPTRHAARVARVCTREKKIHRVQNSREARAALG
jgi:F-type H+-transporting ATPase subunit epsilon